MTLALTALISFFAGHLIYFLQAAAKRQNEVADWAELEAKVRTN